MKSRGLNQRQFSIFLNDLESEYSGLPYFTEVRLLSYFTVLERFWMLNDAIQIFLDSKDKTSTFYRIQCGYKTYPLWSII